MIICLFFASCHLLFLSDNEIQIENNCTGDKGNFYIQVNVSKSSSSPDSFVKVEYGRTLIFTHISNGSNYIHIVSSDSSFAPLAAKSASHQQISVYSNKKYSVTWKDGEYSVVTK